MSFSAAIRITGKKKRRKVSIARSACHYYARHPGTITTSKSSDSVAAKGHMINSLDADLCDRRQKNLPPRPDALAPASIRVRGVKPGSQRGFPEVPKKVGSAPTNSPKYLSGHHRCRPGPDRLRCHARPLRPHSQTIISGFNWPRFLPTTTNSAAEMRPSQTKRVPPAMAKILRTPPPSRRIHSSQHRQ